ncbi:amino acid adenylation domain-containing protein [Streptomyces sp. NPDC058401]|uniref:non-ribosomal peptide synthetase n=1 Tax=Streptomyces sp. NPDC058401 TaxID=3346480 RepID=UPI00365D35B7
MASRSADDTSALPLRIRTVGAYSAPAAARPTRPDQPPLSSAQRALWLLDQLHPASSLYNVPVAVKLTGHLDVTALTRALALVVERHEVLRTVFPRRAGGEPYQRVLPAADVPMDVLDLRAGASPAPGEAAHDETARDETAWQAVRALVEEPFDLAAGPLLRAVLVRLTDEESILGISLHHMVCDGPSLHILFEELSAYYEGPGAVLPALTAQFVDHVLERQASADGPEALGWWREQLAGAPTVLALPTDRPRPAVRRGRGATYTLRLSGGLVAAAGALARHERATPFMVMTAVYSALLGRLSGSRDLLIGTPVAGRDRAELESLIGFFVNTVPLRISLDGDPPFTELLRRVRTSTFGAMAHADVPFDALVENLRIDRDPGTTPLVQTVLTFESSPLARPRFAGLGARLLPILPDAAKFDLDVMILQAPDGSGDFDFCVTYDTDLFEPQTVTRLAERFRAMLAAVVADPALPMHRLPLLTDDETRQATEVWNPAGDEHRAIPGPLVHEWVERQARARPADPALSLDGREVSYAELDARAGALARRLTAADVAPGDVVGILLPRGTELPTAMLGILKCGAAYLPLDLAHPAAHLARILRSAGAAHVVTSAESAPRLESLGVRTVPVEGLSGTAHAAPAERDEPGEPAGQGEPRGQGGPRGQGEPHRVHPEDLAYVIFTSGSTGEPKGVGVPHSALANHARAVDERFGLRSGDRVLQFANAAFDVAAEELFPTWAAGACAVLCTDPPPAERMSAQLDSLGITVANLPASYWQRWVATLPDGDGRVPGTLRLLVVGSEPVDPVALAAWARRTPVPVVNAYGLTETTITALTHDTGLGSGGALVPVGVPLRGVRAYVLDEDLQQLPPGVPGELFIGGAGLARGYLGRPGLTAERFLPDPFVPGARMHRTGDRARRRPDGAVEVLGRIDEQLKVRGYRIEPGEVEAALCTHPEVVQAAVAARTGADGTPRLAGYVVTRTGGVPDDLRAHLTALLPAHLVPGVLVPLAALPLSGSGKVDRSALPEPRPAAPALPDPPAGEPAESDMERMLSLIWQDVLDIGRVGVRDNFFDLGGTSFTLTTVHARLNERLGRRLPLVTLYEHPTIAALAGHLCNEDRPSGPTLPADPQAENRLRAGRARLNQRRRTAL